MAKEILPVIEEGNVRRAIASIDLPNTQETSFFKVKDQDFDTFRPKEDYAPNSIRYQLEKADRVYVAEDPARAEIISSHERANNNISKLTREYEEDAKRRTSIEIQQTTTNTKLTQQESRHIEENNVRNINTIHHTHDTSILTRKNEKVDISEMNYLTPQKKMTPHLGETPETIRHFAVSPFEGERLVEIAGLAFRRHSIDCSVLKKSFEKIAIGGKSNRIFLVGKGSGLYILERQKENENAFKLLLYEGNDSKQYFSIKTNRSGHLVAQETKSNDLIVMDYTGEQILRRLGSYRIDFGRRFITKIVR